MCQPSAESQLVFLVKLYKPAMAWVPFKLSPSGYIPRFFSTIMPIIRAIRNQVSQGISANITSVFSGLRNFPTTGRQQKIQRFFEDELQRQMDMDSIKYSCFIFPDSDIRTSQYVGSCGSAAITVALRHLHPQRIAQTGKRTQPLADFDFEFEYVNNNSKLYLSAVNGYQYGQPTYRGRPGYIVWNQMTYYALTNNQIGSFMQLFNKNNSTKFRLYLHTETTIDSIPFKELGIMNSYDKDSYFLPLSSTNTDIEDRLSEILERNHLPVVLVDGLIWSQGKHYKFPKDDDEWKFRAKNPHTRPDDCTVLEDHPALAELQDLMNEYGCWTEKSHNSRSQMDSELCCDLQRLYHHLKHRLKPTLIGHAVVVTGFYVRRAGGEVLWRVIDSNPLTKLDKLRSQSNISNRDLQGSINYMTTEEIVSRMTGGERSPMILEITSDLRCVNRNSPDQRNLIPPVSLYNW
jgi:hypothetical protein